MTAVGDYAYMQYVGQALYHARLLIGHIAGNEFAIVTPDFDVYIEDIHNSNPDVTDVRLGSANGQLPVGVTAATVYNFAPAVGMNQRRLLLTEGARLADAERISRGLPPAGGAPPIPPGGGLPGAGQIAPGGPGPGGASGEAPAGWTWVLMEDALSQELPFGTHLSVGAAGQPALIHRDGSCGLVRIGTDTFMAMLWQNGAAMKQELSDWRGQDARTLEVKIRNGMRLRQWQEVADDLREDAVKDWPIEAPRTARWCSQYLTKAGGPVLHHEAWRHRRKLDQQSFGVDMHETLARLADYMGSYDQLEISNLASAEFLFRRMALIEHFYDEKEVDHGAAAGRQSLDEVKAFVGGARPGSMVMPELLVQVSKELERVSSIKKNARKLREENASALAGKKKGGKGGAASSGTAE